jgi:hypothetical protein
MTMKDSLTRERVQLERDGWVIVRDVFTAQEVEALRVASYRSKNEGYYLNDLLSNPHLRHLVVDERILGIARAFLGNTPVYFGDSSLMIERKDARVIQGFHKDNTDREDPTAPDWQSRYSIIRVGLYLEDHTRHSEGLVVRSGSHRYCDLTKGRKRNVLSRPGDVVAWYLTTTHCGGAKILRLFSNVVLVEEHSGTLLGRLAPERWIPRFLIAKPDRDRIFLAMSFGIRDAHLERHLRYKKTRRYQVRRWQLSKYDPRFLESSRGKDLDILSMHDEVKDTDLSRVPEEYVQPPHAA